MTVQPFLPGGWLFRRRLHFGAAVCVATMLVCLAAEAAQEKNDKDDEKEGPPKAEEVVLPVGDGLELAATYFPGSEGKDSVPVVLLHMWKRSRNDYKELAPFLQRKGYAVLVPDLRGHGDSTTISTGTKVETLDAAKMSARQFPLMVTQDMKAVKDFLWDRNNAKELNLDKLCVVGAEMGASVALQFALYDAVGYDNNRVWYGPLKLGEFVKGLVLISPKWSFRGLKLTPVFAHPKVRSNISVLIMVGEGNSKAVSDARRIHKIFKRYHPEPDPDQKTQQKTLFFGRMKTSLQGTKMLGEGLNVEKFIAMFIDQRLVKSTESKKFTWKERKRPHQ